MPNHSQSLNSNQMELKQLLNKTVLIAAALWIAVGTANSQTIGTDAGYVGTGAPVGSLPLALDVSPMGAPTGSMPFDLPAGFGNVTPQLGLVYSSSLGLGNMGYGFALSGVSSITVAGQDYWHDGNVTPVNFNGNDRFYLDGARLILESSTYGANGAKYLTENYNFATITSTGSTNSQPVSFTVVTKDGTTMEYGGSAAIAKVSSNGTTKTTAWLIKKITDKRGNYIEYTYSNTTDGQIKLTAIKYTGNIGDNIQPQYTVKITYGTRTAEYSYVSGYKITNSLYVTAVAVTDASNTEVVKYTFSYSNNRLTTINKYYMGRLACNPTKINWNSCNINNDPRINNGTQPCDFIKNSTKFETFCGDVDGDMQADIVRVDRSKNGKFAYYTKQGNKLVEKYKGNLPANNQYSSGSSFTTYESRGRGYDSKYLKSTTKQGALPYTFFDIDNDGSLELCIIESVVKNNLDKVNFCVYKLSANGLTKLDSYTKNFGQIVGAYPFFAGKFDGTGHIDLTLFCREQQSANSNKRIDLVGIDDSFLSPFELNGDCKTELISLQGNTIKLFAPEEQRGKYTMVLKTSINVSNVDPKLGIEPADFNGDGLTDILVYSNGWKLYLNTGGQFSLQSSAVSELNASRKVTQGRQQVAISASPLQRDYDNGEYRKRAESANGLYDSQYKNAYSNIYKIADFDNDGKADIIRIERDVTYLNDADDVINTMYRIKLFKFIGNSFTCVKTYSTGMFRQVGFDPATITSATDIDYVIGKFEYCTGQLVGGSTQFEVTDYNEDGFPELLVSTTHPVVVDGVRKESSEITLQFYSGNSQQFISSVTDGMGVCNSLSFGKLNSSNYTRSSETHSGGVYSCPLPLWVVSGKKTTAGNITASNISYSYEGLLLHKQRGMLGFEITLASDAVTNLTTECTFNYDPTYIVPYLEEKRIYYGSNHTLEFSEFGYDFIDKDKSKKCYIQRLANDRKYYKGGKNIVTAYTYNSNNDLTKTTTKYGSDATDVVTFGSYTSLGKPKTIKTERTQSGKTFSYSLTYTYDSYGNALSETDSRTGVKTTYTYNTKNHTNVEKIAETGLNTTTNYTYDATKRFITSTSVKYDNGTTLTTSTTYDNFGRPLTETDHNGLQTKYRYDNFGQLAVVTSPDDDYTTTAYGWATDATRSEITNHTQTKTRLGDTETIYYDALGREIKRVTMPAGGTTETVNTYYLSNGKVNYTQSSINGLTSYTYEEYYGDLSSITSRGRTVNYLSSGMTQKTTVDGVSTAKTYNSLGQIKKVTDAASTIEYTYHPCGSPLTITAAGATTSMEYDSKGRQTKLTDPDAGATTYEYDNLGRLTKQTDARGVVTNITYDAFGRETTRTEKMGSETRTISTSYYTAKPHIGLVKSQTDSQSGITTSYTYDDYGRLLTKTDKIDGKDYKFIYGYDDYGHHIETTYPSGEHIKYNYNGGFLTEIQSVTGQSGTKLISDTKHNARGQVTSYKQGNNNTANYSFNSYGYPTAISYGPTSQRIAYNYTWNTTTQNLTSRSMGGYTENFTYDAADRLTGWTINSTAYTADYSGNGNITMKSDFGLYAYSGSRPHAVSGISSLIAGTGAERTCEAEYNTIGKVSKLVLKNGSTTLKTATFTYAADGQRRKMQIGNSTTIYVDDYQVNKNGNTEQRLHYISGPAGLCALIVQSYNGSTLSSRATYYLQTDYQGSIIAAYNSNGTLYKRFAYDPWGRRRAGDNWTNYQTSTETLITRGYCGHEHLDDFGTINMNGRIYDPRLGRFLSPDPYVQAPYNSQNYNRYSYCLNNPLKYTDPSGEFWHIIIGAVVGGVINLGVKAYQGKINSIGDGLMAFGIGAAAGAVGAATGGSAFLAAGGGAAGAGGFLAGAASGMVGSAFSAPIQSIGNSMYFGDPMMSAKQYLIGIGIGGLLGGTVNGVVALSNGKTFWAGNIKGNNIPTHCSVPLKVDEPKLNTDGLRAKMESMPDNNSYTLETSSSDVINRSIEGQKLSIAAPRPEIQGYSNTIADKLDLSHNFPYSFDKVIVQNGDFSFTTQGNYWYVAPGSINSTNGWYSIGMSSDGTVFHRCFSTYYPFVK
jgi:RHS repeat-associated protein